VFCSCPKFRAPSAYRSQRTYAAGTPKYAEWSPSRFIRWAEKTGPHTARLVKTIIESHAHPEQGYRSCLGILRLEKHYPKERLENAALRALRYSNLSLKALRKSWRTDSTVWKKKTLAQQPYCRPMTTSVAANITTDQ
jgi:hypothetical protein